MKITVHISPDAKVAVQKALAEMTALAIKALEDGTLVRDILKKKEEKMSAIDDLKAKPKVERTALEWAVLVCYDTGGEATGADAAQELARLKAIAEEERDVIDHTLEMALHHTESVKKPPMFSRVSRSYYNGRCAEAWFFVGLLRRSKKRIAKMEAE